jgi:antirestriction protein ArdC
MVTDFDSEEEYFASLFHELAHATGHVTRLNRNLTDKSLQAEEELIAELTASYLCAYCGIENKTIDNQSRYIAAWLEHLKADKRFIVKVASKAREAANYILDKS